MHPSAGITRDQDSFNKEPKEGLYQTVSAHELGHLSLNNSNPSRCNLLLSSMKEREDLQPSWKDVPLRAFWSGRLGLNYSTLNAIQRNEGEKLVIVDSETGGVKFVTATPTDVNSDIGRNSESKVSICQGPT